MMQADYRNVSYQNIGQGYPNNNNNNSNDSILKQSNDRHDTDSMRPDNNNNIHTNYNTPNVMSKRQRLRDLVRSTKDYYLPTITSTITQKTREGIKAVNNTTAGLYSHDPYSVNGIPFNVDIHYYPTYSTYNDELKKFETVIRLGVGAPGDPKSKRNRIIMSLCKRYLRTGNEEIFDSPMSSRTTSRDITPTNTNPNFEPNYYLNSPNSSSSDFSNDSGYSRYSYNNGDNSHNMGRYGLSSRPNSNQLNYADSYSDISDSYQSELDILQTRVNGFLEKKVPNLPVTIELIANPDDDCTTASHNSMGSSDGYDEFDDSDDNESHLSIKNKYNLDISKSNSHNDVSLNKTYYATTDYFGDIYLRTKTNFLPTQMRITLNLPDNFPKQVSKRFAIDFIKGDGVALISDIDDTIKHTGVTGDKMSMFRNVFIHPLDSWLIDGLPNWYNNLQDQLDVDFFYVSNSPLQMFQSLEDYIQTYYPPGPLYLKQYSGNLLSSIMVSSASRKLEPITRLMKDFPSKKFILVGDSGEQDFEAYIDTALNFKDQVISIYIRCCKNSMSDFPEKEQQVMFELNELIRENYTDTFLRKQRSKSKKAPPIPTKKPILTPEQIRKIKNSRTINKVHVSLPQPPLTPRRAQTTSSFKIGSHIDLDFDSRRTAPSVSTVIYDKKEETWKRRVNDGLNLLKSIDPTSQGISLMFFNDPNVVCKDSFEEIENLRT
ncbi:hypothetical protein TBLA_0B01510 [Henningerozyma blattae CBS 6284]|uniref:Phosphatidate phosphatase APP1 catalytic domain-containing protein n=1 Tax=Henningerozyma blattae (strain ATCC 34711 / CBS 6284 / DSM 70876 / NBRC 10599 / NRRL Y-10934 / UCD 77-7) TaxID=1071380 RepID=I2GXZ2_HENB6|nr:hypothetical protein TBLA_0B01510 [Tetrapisispora blattae CBS 6284]CCH58994.1 hypothetical protein TBLA_0B01510 [Tetrapisispora blattae CBS 6284]